MCPRAHDFIQHSSRSRRQTLAVERGFERAQRTSELECAFACGCIEVVPRGVVAKLVDGMRAMRARDLFDE
jgi:hypothetical protein